MTAINKDTIEGNWKQFKGKIQERAGIARDEAEKQLADWETRHPDARFHD